MVENSGIGDTVKGVRFNFAKNRGRTVADFSRDVVAGTKSSTKIEIFGVVDIPIVANRVLMLVIAPHPFSFFFVPV